MNFADVGVIITPIFNCFTALSHAPNISITHAWRTQNQKRTKPLVRQNEICSTISLTGLYSVVVIFMFKICTILFLSKYYFYDFFSVVNCPNNPRRKQWMNVNSQLKINVQWIQKRMVVACARSCKKRWCNTTRNAKLERVMDRNSDLAEYNWSQLRLKRRGL